MRHHILLKLNAYFIFVVLGATSCGELPSERERLVDEAQPWLVASRHSTQGCELDNDCEQGLHCFQYLCVSGCVDNDECHSDAVCNDRGRCVIARQEIDEESPERALGRAIDQSAESYVPDTLPATLIVGVITDQIFIPPSADEVVATLLLNEPLPAGGLAYTLAFHNREDRTPVRIAHGDTRVEIPISLVGNMPEQGKALGVDIVSAAGRVTVYLVQPMRVDGLYAGQTKLSTFGGASLPIEFLIETQPANVTDLNDAQSAYLLVSSAANRILSLPRPSAKGSWGRAPLTWDPATNSWVAVVAAPVDGQRVFGEPLYPNAERSFRIELKSSDDEPGVFRGAWTDRWHGISDRITQDGIVRPASFGSSGTFAVARAGDRMDVDSSVLEPFPQAWQQLPAPRMPHCSDQDVSGLPGDGMCQDLGSLAAFEAATPEQMSECAIEYTSFHATSTKLADQLYAFLDPARENPSGMSFSQFLEACAAKQDGICVSTRQAECGRELAAYAYRVADAASGDATALAHIYSDLTQEIFLGAKLAAFQSDTSARLEWLKSSEAPLFLAGPLKDYNIQLLRDWQAQVLDTLVDSVFGQLDDAGLAFLSRTSSDAGVIAMRETMLLDLGVLWQSAADSLSLYAKRLNLIEDNDTKRYERAEALYHQYFRLYVAGTIIAEFGRDVSASAQNVSIGNYLSALEKDISALGMPFNSLVLARANEVVTAHSLDPSSNSRSLIRERYDDAMRAIKSAQQSVDLVHEESRLNDFTLEKLRAQYEGQVLSLRNELIGLCGLPFGCDPQDVGVDPACQINVQAGACGLTDLIDEAGILKPREVSISGAGLALHDIWVADSAVDIEQEKQSAALARITLSVQAIDDYVRSMSKQQALRKAANREIDQLVRDIGSLRNNLLSSQLRGIAQQQSIREQAFKQQEAAMQAWSRIIANGVEADMKLIRRANTASMNAQILNFTAERISGAADVAATAVPEPDANIFQFIVNIIQAVVQTTIKTAGYITSTTLGSIAVNMNIQADSMERELSAGGDDNQYVTLIRDTQELGAKRSQNDIAALEAEINAANLRTDVEIQAAFALIDALERALEMDEAFDRAVMELRDRQDALLSEKSTLDGYGYHVAQAKLTVQHHGLAYEAVVQRAQVLEARFRSAQNRWANIENILGSPDVVFSFSNRIALAESRLDTARIALQEWLIALEYYAVRPFVAQRMAILLARNPQQLEAIAFELERLQGACGGAITRERVDVSLRDNLLGLNISTLLEASENGASDLVATPAERFRALMSRANTPVNRQARLNARQTIGQRLAQGDVWAANFTLSVHDFANLPQTCNAKVDSIAARLIGFETLETQPVVTIVYDGSSEMRSCQANIRELVTAVGPEATSFGPVTRFRTGARAISPVAGVGDFGPARTWNATLEGTPLAAGYTVMIDKTLPANRDIPWEQLEDIRLQFAYSYQDVFPDGQCE